MVELYFHLIGGDRKIGKMEGFIPPQLTGR